MCLYFVELFFESQNEKGVIETSWNENGTHILLYHDGKIWRSEVKDETVAIFSSHLRMDHDEYMSHLKNGLTTQTQEFKYSFENDSLILSRPIDKDFEVQFCELICLQISEPTALSQIVADLMKRNNETRLNLKIITKEKDILDEEFKKCTDAMQIMVEAKKEMEDVLCRKFLVILNEKKKKIAELMNRKVAPASDDEETIGEVEKSENKFRFSGRSGMEEMKQFGVKDEEIMDEDDDIGEIVPNSLTIPIRKPCMSDEALAQPGPSTR